MRGSSDFGKQRHWIPAFARTTIRREFDFRQCHRGLRANPFQTIKLCDPSTCRHSPAAPWRAGTCFHSQDPAHALTKSLFSRPCPYLSLIDVVDGLSGVCARCLGWSCGNRRESFVRFRDCALPGSLIVSSALSGRIGIQFLQRRSVNRTPATRPRSGRSTSNSQENRR